MRPLIAIVEDDESLRTALVGLVRSLGYDGCGHDSAEAFIASGSTKAACLVTDLQLPGMNGLELARQLQGELPVILVTAHTGQGIEARAAACGVLCTFPKPFDADELAECLRGLLDS